MDIGISIVVTFLLVLVNGYFSMSEMALVNAKHVLLQKDADEGDKKAQRALSLASDSGQFLATIQVAITLVGFFASAAAATNLSDPLAQWLSGFGVGWLSVIAPGLAPVLITLIVSYLSIVVGELVPKRMALADAERVSKTVAGPLMVFQKVARPLVALTSASANGLSRLLRIKNADERQSVSEEEIKYMVTDNDELLPDEKRMIHDILDLGDMTVHEIMQPRVDMILVEDTETVRQAVDRMRGTGYSRLPVFHEDIDRIVGIVHYKDLVGPLMDGKENEPVADYAYEALFVPETKDLFPLLSEMQTNRQQMAIVVDEYGGTDGLITVEDIVEEIVGEIIDESDIENKFITPLSDGTWLVDGRFPVEDALKLGWPVTESDDYETMAGWLMGMIDFVPQVGDEFEFGGYRFKIQAMRRRRISNIRVTREVGADNAPAVQAEDDAGRDPAEAAAENAEHPASH
ncbi:MAG: HlyC/CorC family transporter [Gordonibacter pamelaeae]|uniref:Hemolysins and related proteins containing CBS domains n=2 Tax=Gordonibacter pamelaeae TaxID=471189 RepID=D6E7Y7_9ACTN|nr:hemolysin family protein [Gordonibacter pamelaeae]HJH73712.1 hemolysin family protein [Eggerthellaceae bacterium]MBS4894248.1 HlyC/CorC family transporter [Gordonibacter pamelaeae]MCB6310910.1 hemolysin family protein [Gordonibacter pamelaeae]RDB66985.1 HlyC/CorC family transporter [Gordonibacter pamelaeae]CBL03834.1 Hemolysins and related proteins containing CBS domains [Gordonibacter pamelaeae 7-10-1-b]